MYNDEKRQAVEKCVLQLTVGKLKGMFQKCDLCLPLNTAKLGV